MEMDPLRKSVIGHLVPRDLGFCNPTRYPLINIHTAVAFSMMLGYPGPALSSIDPDRWEEIPDIGSFIRMDDKWPAEWPE